MYAIIKTGGKQYRVRAGQTIDVELLNGSDKEVTFEEVLFFHDGSKAFVGQPVLSGFVVKGELVNDVAGPKILCMKYKRSHHQYRRIGHRQHYSRVKILEIAQAA